ncbi:MAG: hypothetical protein NC343_02340 [Muribaculum sp.]|nr:hypothetical protein [Muribaculaceae bacterium]MCM1080565.1 hypothetical protein [Muribaculum sp.]
MKQTYLISLIAVMSLMACGGGDGLEQNVTGGRYPDDDADKEQENSATRYVDPTHNIIYDNGGVMLRYMEGTAGDTVSLIEMETGSEILFTWLGKLKTGLPDNGRIRIDGVEHPEFDINVKQLNKKGAWIYIHAPDYTGVLVVER